MPRIRQKEDEYAMADFIAEVNAQRGRYGFGSQKAFGGVLGVCQATAGNYIRNPESIPLGAMRSLVKALKPDPGVILRAVGYSPTEIKKFREKG